MNDHSKMYDDIKKWFNDGYWNKKKVRNAVMKNKITAEEYTEITGEPYMT